MILKYLTVLSLIITNTEQFLQELCYKTKVLLITMNSHSKKNICSIESILYSGKTKIHQKEWGKTLRQNRKEMIY